MIPRVGIYPAAFDPVHNGHLAFAKAVKDKYHLDKVFFLPEPTPAHKQGVKALEHRSNMVHLATANDQSFGLLVLDVQDFDLRYIWPRITSRFLGSELFMLIGNNPVRRLGSWPHTTEFGKQAPTFIIASRNKSLEEVHSTIETLLQTKKLEIPFEILQPDYRTFNAPEIRRIIKAGGKPAGVPQVVYEYIQQNKLYISGAT